MGRRLVLGVLGLDDGGGDTTAPTVEITSAAAATVVAPFDITITFSEAVTGFAAGDITLSNGTLYNFADSGDSTTFTATVLLVAAGSVTVDVAAGVCTDAAGNPNTAATQLSRTAAIASFIITTTGAQQLSIDELDVAVGETLVVSWGDGQTSNLTGDGTNVAHDYAGAGTWYMTVEPAIITRLSVDDSKFGCAAGNIGKLTSLTYLRTLNVNAVIIGAGEIGSLVNLQTLLLQGGSNVTIGADELSALTSLATLVISLVPGVAFQTGLASLPALTLLRYENILSEAQVDSVLTQLYAAFPTRTGTSGTIDLRGASNAAPSGAVEAPGDCNTATWAGGNYAHELVNDSCDVSAKHWASVDVESP